MQSQKAVSTYFASEQILSFAFPEQYCFLSPFLLVGLLAQCPNGKFRIDICMPGNSILLRGVGLSRINMAFHTYLLLKPYI